MGTFPGQIFLRDGLAAKSQIVYAALQDLEMHWR
jgi:hypothetical protein